MLVNISALKPSKDNANIEDKERAFLLTMRQALLMQLGAIEDRLNIERSVTPKHRRG